MKAPDGPGEAPAGRPGGGVKRLFAYGFAMCQRFPCILRFGPCCWRSVRIVKLNDGSRDLPASHSDMFLGVKREL